jgi:hypothetical protein
MKCLKEPLSRLANRQDKTRGAFFEGRFGSVAVVDDESLLSPQTPCGLPSLTAKCGNAMVTCLLPTTVQIGSSAAAAVNGASGWSGWSGGATAHSEAPAFPIK